MNNSRYIIARERDRSCSIVDTKWNADVERWSDLEARIIVFALNAINSGGELIAKVRAADNSTYNDQTMNFTHHWNEDPL